MINKKQILATLILSALSLNAFAQDIKVEVTSTWNTQEENIEVSSYAINSVDVIDEKTIWVNFDKSLPNTSANSLGKVLEDASNIVVSTDAKDLKKLTLNLDKQLENWAKYSLISISEWFNASIDFTYLDNQKEVKAKDNLSIDKLTFVSPTNVEIYLTKEVNIPKHEFKLFKEISSESMFSNNNNLSISLQKPLSSFKSYILVLELKDFENKDIEVENSLFDFNTQEFMATPPVVVEENQETLNEDVAIEAPLENTNLSENTSSWENIEDVAMSAWKTPDTWTKTNILILITLILTSSLLLLRKKSLKI